MTRPPSGSPDEPPSSAHTRIIRRAPTGPIPIQHPVGDDTRTGIIRRTPSGTPPAPPTEVVPVATGLIPAAKPPETARPTTAVTACVIAMITGWPTSVVATSLITGWWDTDRLFCLAVGFLALVFAASTVAGVVLLLLRNSVGRYLIAVGAVVALLAVGGVFIAGAKIPWIVYCMPVLPVLSALFALHPATKRWAQ